MNREPEKTAAPEKIVSAAIKDPGKIYESPEEVVADPRLTRDQKGKILHSWEEDEIALQRAEGENMLQPSGEPKSGEILEKVKNAEKILENCRNAPSAAEEGGRMA
jgi:hypothetical protein